jgi:DDE domain
MAATFGVTPVSLSIGMTAYLLALYLNNVIEQHHRNVKSRTNVMFGFKQFSSAAVVIAGVELAHRIRKGQFDFAELGFKETTAPAVCDLPTGRFSHKPDI